MSTAPNRRYTAEEYLAIERKAASKSEFYRGEIFAMAGASLAHTIIVANILAELRQQLKGRRYTTHSSDLRIKVPRTTLYTYPDASVICGEPQFDDMQHDTVLNPTLIVEVLSDSTANYDRGEKFEQYRKLDSLKQYVLIEQDHPHIDTYIKDVDGRWVLSGADGLEAIAPLTSIDGRLALSEVYDKVEFPERDLERAGIFRS